MRRFAPLLRALALSSTALFLLAPGCPQTPHDACKGQLGVKEAFPEQSLPMDVAGDCGPPGSVTLQTVEASCDLSVRDGPTLGLPAHGWREHVPDGELMRGGWTAGAQLDDAGLSIHCGAEAAGKEQLRLQCTRSDGTQCTALLTRQE